MSLPKNVTVLNTWTSLSDLLESDYNASKGYFLHINNKGNQFVAKLSTGVPILRATLQNSTPAENYQGSEYCAYVDIEVDPGDNLWLKSNFSGNNRVSIEVYEVA